MHQLRGMTASLWIAAQLLGISALCFAGLALLVKGRAAITAAKRAAKEVRLNLSMSVLDVLFVAPFAVVLVRLIHAGVGSIAFGELRVWEQLPQLVTFVIVVFVGDFFSYWRHRLEHTRWL